MNTKMVLVGALSGLVAAAVTDLQAWAASEGKFQWGLALRRWFVGVITGAAAGAGLPGAGS